MTAFIRKRRTHFADPFVCSLLRNNPLTTPFLVSVVVMQAFVIAYITFGKLQILKDLHFGASSENPQADVYTSMLPHKGFLPELPYTTLQGSFWSMGAPVVGDFYLVVFLEPQALDRITIETGKGGRLIDRLEHDVLKGSLKVVRSEDRVECMHEVDLGAFKSGRVEVTEVTGKVKARVACLRIVVSGGQKNWLKIKNTTVLVLQI